MTAAAGKENTATVRAKAIVTVGLVAVWCSYYSHHHVHEQGGMRHLDYNQVIPNSLHNGTHTKIHLNSRNHSERNSRIQC
jgi:hypothetical protein